MDKVRRWAMARSRDWRRWVLERWTWGRMLCWFVGQDVQVPVMCAFFSEESGESLDIRSATGGCYG